MGPKLYQSVTGRTVLTIAAKVRSKRQKRVVEHLSKVNPKLAIDYMSTFQGAGAKRADVNVRYGIESTKRHNFAVDGHDKLAGKPDGWILELLKAKTDPRTAKKPGDYKLGEWIGVEIECFIPLDNVLGDDWRDEYSEAFSSGERIVRDLLQVRKVRNVQMKHDGSINADDGCMALEFAVVFHKNDRSNLEALCNVLRELGAEVNKSCGLHVHLDCRDLFEAGRLNARKAGLRANRIVNALPVLAEMVPASRRANTYCRLGKSRRPSSSDRYWAVNTTALSRFKTIEVRLHSGTTSFSKINNWIDLLWLISREPRLTRGKVTDPGALFSRCRGIDASLRDYVVNRIAAFRVTDAEESATEQAA